MEKLFQIFDQTNKVKSRELFKQGLVRHIDTDNKVARIFNENIYQLLSGKSGTGMA